MVGGEVELGFLGIVCTSHWHQRKKHPGFLIRMPKCWAIEEDGLVKLKSCPQLSIKNGFRLLQTDIDR